LQEKGVAVPTVLDERIEEYILEGITEECSPTFNEDLIATETLKNINIGIVEIPWKKACINSQKSIMPKLDRLLMLQFLILTFKGNLVLKSISW